VAIGRAAGGSVQGDHSFPGEGLGEPDAVTAGLADVGVVHQPVDGGGSLGLGHQLVESGRMKAGADDHASFLAGGVYQATWRPAWTAAWPRASSRKVLPVPDRPQTTRFSCRPIHSRVRSAAWVGAGTEDSRSSQAAKILPVGKAARARRVASAERSRPATSSASSARSTSAGSHRWPFHRRGGVLDDPAEAADGTRSRSRSSSGARRGRRCSPASRTSTATSSPPMPAQCRAQR
jgi:hypothetical protein